MQKKKSLARFLFTNENSGDFSGAGTFQGGPFGFGNRHQLADSEVWPGLVDPAEDLPGNPSMWPAVHAQEDSDKDQYGSLEDDEVYDDRNHISPMEDGEREDMLDPKHDTEPGYFYTEDGVLTERGPSDGTYRDLPGWPPMNTLADKEDHVPEDEDPDRDPEEDPEEERYTVPNLLPSPREGDRGKPFGHGRFDDETNLTLDRGSKTDTNMYDPMNSPNPDGTELKLNVKRNKTLNRWKETDQESMGHTNRDEIFNHLVKPENFIKKSWGQNDIKKELDEPDDVQMAVGYSGVIVNPVKHVPGPVDIYSRSPGYVRENKDKKPMAKPTKEKRVNYIPKDLDKTHPEETYGTGMGRVLKPYDHFPDDFGNKEIKRFDPLKRDNPMIPYSYDRERVVEIIQTKLLQKLAKLKDKK